MIRLKTKHRTQNTRAYLIYFALALLLVCGLLAVHIFVLDDSDADTGASSDHSSTKASEPDAAHPGFNKGQYSVSDPASLWVVVNKGRRLPSGYVPGDLVIPSVKLRYGSGNEMRLRRAAAEALKDMFDGAAAANVKLMDASAYRSYSLQSSVYNRHVNTIGKSEADKVSARPGHSEHQTGWAIDVAPASGKCMIETCFGDLPEGQWVKANAHLYGFVIRYPKGKEQLTGYSHEPWHIRYVGSGLAGELYRAGQTLEQFFDLPSQPSYPTAVVELK